MWASICAGLVTTAVSRITKLVDTDFVNAIRTRGGVCVWIHLATKSTKSSFPTNIYETVYIHVTIHVMQITKKVMKHISYEIGV